MVIVISQRHESDLDPPAIRVAGVFVERVFSGSHQLGTVTVAPVFRENVWASDTEWPVVRHSREKKIK